MSMATDNPATDNPGETPKIRRAGGKPSGEPARPGGKGDKTPAPARASVPIPKAKRGLGSFFGDVRRELTKVSWPTPSETTRLTGVVLAVCALLAVVLGAMGFLFENLINLIQGTPR